MGYLKLSDAHEDGTRRIMLAMPTSPIGLRAMETIVKNILACSGKEQEGVAPRGGVARRIEELLAEANRYVKKKGQ